MNEDPLVVAEIVELLRLDLVLFGFGVVHVLLSGAEAPCALHHALLAEKVSGLDRFGFADGAEDEAVAAVQGEHFGLVVVQRWH